MKESTGSAGCHRWLARFKDQRSAGFPRGLLGSRVVKGDSRPVWVFALARKVVRGLFVHHAFDHAATMAFYFFLGTIPLLLVGGLLIGQLVAQEGVDYVTAPLYQLVPGVTGELIRNELHAIAGSAGVRSLAPLSVVGFLWLTSNGFHNLMDVFELLIGARPRSWLRQRAIATAWVVTTLSVTIFCVWFVLAMTGWLDGVRDASHLPDLLRRVRDELAAGWRRMGVLLVFGSVTTVGLAAFYRIAVVHPRGVRRRVWSGAFVAIGLWALVSWGFGAFVGTIGQYSVYYGSLATVAVTLLWFYLSSLAFLIGAEVNAQLEGVREPQPTPAL
jgi:membrane protein